MRFSCLVVVAALFATAVVAQSTVTTDGAGIEEIYVARSLRQAREEPTQFCVPERTGFADAIAEDRYTFHSVATRVVDGLMTSANEGTIGLLHACIGATSDPLISNFYAEGSLGQVSLKAIGDCRATRVDYPEPGVTFYACSFRLIDLPEDYVGGHLTTSTITSREAVGDVSDPIGYVQPSIATIRLWKRR